MKRIIALNFFPAFVPPTSGGEARYFHIYQKISEFFDVTLVSHSHPGDDVEIIQHHAHFREIRVGKEQVYIDLHQRMQAEGTGPECSALVCALAGDEFQTQYGKICAELFKNADCVIHESPYTLPFDSDFNNKNSAPRIYNSYNVESLLVEQILSGPESANHHRWVSKLERELVLGCELVFATSDQDAENFKRLFGLETSRLRFVPNGYEPNYLLSKQRRFGDSLSSAHAIFVGSGNHLPNIDAAECIVETIAPAIASVHFDIVGSVCQRLEGKKLPPNVTLHGFMSDSAKSELICQCAFGLNPMNNGGGTNLKLIEYLSSGLTVITTELGSRGLGIVHNHHAVVTPAALFATTLNELLGQPERCKALAAAGQELVRKQFTWSSIALEVKKGIEQVCGIPKAVKTTDSTVKLLVLNDFPVADGYGGGQVRIKEMYRALPDHYQVSLLCLHNGTIEEAIQIDHRFRQTAVPKTKAHLFEDNATNAIAGISIGDLVSGRHCLRNERFCLLLKQMAADADIVIFEHPFLAPLLDLLPPEKAVIYSSLNVESQIKSDILKSRPDFSVVIEEVKRLENRLLHRANIITAVCETDAQTFRSVIPQTKIVVLLNGVNLKADTFLFPFSKFKSRFKGMPVACFLGSSHLPNVEAACFIVDSLAPKLPDVAFLLVGSVCDAVSHRSLPSNVLLAGLVSSAEKQVLQHLSDVMINPMNSGGGSSLKVADALGAGSCLLTTLFGARGFDLLDGNHICVAELPDFAKALTELINDPAKIRQVAINARRYATENLNWNVIALQFHDALTTLVTQPVALENDKQKKSLLVVTHRYTTPPRGGAEVYLDQLLSRLGANGRWAITVVTIDSTNIDNHQHFSAVYSNDSSQDIVAKPNYIGRLYKFPVAMSKSLTTSENCTKLGQLWSGESLSLARQALEDTVLLGSKACLLGGWYPAEGDADSCMRWTAATAEIFIPAGLGENFVVIAGHCPSIKSVVVQVNGKEVVHTEVGLGSFTIRIPLDPLIEQIITLETEAILIGNDSRPLGLWATAIILESNKLLAQNDDILDKWRASSPENWIDALLNTTLGRDTATDQLFTQTRGPNSPALEGWLRSNVQSYDVVLAHELPFALAPMAVGLAAAQAVPAVLLPHIHVEDRYYHWQTYIKSYRQASLTLLSPKAAKPLYFDKLGGVNSMIVRGGAVSTEEFSVNELKHREAFRKVYPDRRPFIIVLGRKSGAKRYQMAIDAMALVNARGIDAQLVLVGPDEDSVPVNQRNVTYLGAQPRNIVLGALFESVGLANMSQSESFGIVILEAWMASKPVAVNKNSLAFQELVEHGKNGWLCDDVEELANAFESMLENTPLSNAIGSTGKEIAISYTWDAVAREIEEALCGVLLNE